MKNEVLLTISRNGTFVDDYIGWTEVEINKSLETLSGSFSISLTQLFNSDNVVTGFSIFEGDECTLKINDKSIIVGYIDSMNINYSASSHTINVQGRDKTADLIDSSLIGNADLIASYTAKRLVEHILSILGITDIKVINNTGLTLIYDSDFNADAGKNAWQQLDKYLQKKSIFATVDENGNIVLYRGSFGNTSQGLLHLIQGGNVNNVLTGTRQSNLTERYNKISIVSQSDSTITSGFFYQQGGESFSAIDETIRNTRQFEMIANASLASSECQDLANFQKNIRQARGTSYIYTIQGFTQNNGDLWLPNYEVHIEDEFFGIKDYYLIKSVTFRQDNDNGSITTLQVVDKNAYSLREPVTITNQEKGLLFEI